MARLTKGFLRSINLDDARRMFQHWMGLAGVSVIRRCLYSLGMTFTGIGFLAGIDSRGMRGFAYWLGDRGHFPYAGGVAVQRSISA